MQISNLTDLTKINASEFMKIDPQKISVPGMSQGDCSIIAQTFERGAHSTPSEAAVFSTLNRSLENTIQFSDTAIDSMIGYLRSPQEDANKASSQSQAFASDAVPDLGQGGTNAPTDHILQSLNIGNTSGVTFGASFGDKLLEFSRDCVPCGSRLFSFLELHPNINLLEVMESDVLRRLGVLKDIGNLLNNFDIYGDFCQLLNSLSFLCIPDLQRIISLLMSLFMLDLPELDGFIGLLQSLIAPIFSPLLMGITSLMDQFVLLVTNPLECVIDAINLQLSKLGFELDPDSSIDQTSSVLSSGLSELSTTLQRAKQSITDKLNFYIEEIDSLLGEMSGGDSSYVLASLKRLKIIRLISFVTAVIKAISQGHAACNSVGKTPEEQEIDNFFNTFLNPNSPFIMYIDNNGEIVIDEKPAPEESLPVDLSNTGNVLEFQGNPIVDITVLQTAEQVSDILTQQARIIVPCRLEVSAAEADKVNQFIGELNQL